MATQTPDTGLAADIEATRRFARFFTRQLKVIEPKHLHTSFSLPEARVVYELAQRAPLSPGQLAGDLDIDAGQLSRLLRELERREIVTRTDAKSDKRQTDVALTEPGRAAFAELKARTVAHVEQLLKTLDVAARGRVIGAMARIERELGAGQGRRPIAVLRTHRPGDIGWIVSRHGALYHQEYGWDISFEQLVAEIAALFLKTHDPQRERCWIAEVDGEPVGTVMLVNGGDSLAKLRLLIVEPSARGLGIGRALTSECIRFAREAGYTRMTLWTQSILIAARAIYRAAGFQLVKEEPHHSFGHDLIGETWERDLGA
jgi:DNA-binding MarR family transcriptional regulator/N-acetylglutamate synthase-like GNAT family acetyltransferase